MIYSILSLRIQLVLSKFQVPSHFKITQNKTQHESQVVRSPSCIIDLPGWYISLRYFVVFLSVSRKTLLCLLERVRSQTQLPQLNF